MSTLMLSRTLPTGCSLQVRLGDLTTEPVDAIVNAANSQLAHGGGVAGAVLARGGYVIQAESNAWITAHGSVPTGQVAWTSAGSLPCRWVIHAVGPIWSGGSANEDVLLETAVTNSLQAAIQLGCRSISLPAISSGIFGFPKPRCAQRMLAAVLAFDTSLLDEVRMTNIDVQTTDIFTQHLSEILPEV